MRVAMGDRCSVTLGCSGRAAGGPTYRWRRVGVGPVQAARRAPPNGRAGRAAGPHAQARPSRLLVSCCDRRQARGSSDGRGGRHLVLGRTLRGEDSNTRGEGERRGRASLGSCLESCWIARGCRTGRGARDLAPKIRAGPGLGFGRGVSGAGRAGSERRAAGGQKESLAVAACSRLSQEASGKGAGKGGGAWTARACWAEVDGRTAG